MQKLGPQILGSKVISDIAIIKDFESGWVFDHQFLTREINVGAVYNALFQAASEQRFNIDIVSSTSELNGYKIVFAPQMALMDDQLAGRLRRFVEQGGVLIMSAHSAIKDKDNAFTAGTIPIGLTDVFGVELDSFQTYQPPSGTNNAIHFDDGSVPPVQVFAEVLRPTTARVIGRWDRDYLKDSPAATEQQFGKGKAIYYGSLFDLDAARYLTKRYASEMGLKPLVTDVPDQIEVTCRTKAGNDFYFLLNHGDSSANINVGGGFSDVLSGGPAATNFTLPPFGYRVLKRERLSEQVHK